MTITIYELGAENLTFACEYALEFLQKCLSLPAKTLDNTCKGDGTTLMFNRYCFLLYCCASVMRQQCYADRSLALRRCLGEIM